MIVTVQSSNVLSPATFRVLPLKGISILPKFDAGSADALHKNLKIPFSASSPGLHASAIAVGKVGIDTSNRLGLVPPPISFDLNCESVLVSAVVLSPPYVIHLMVKQFLQLLQS